MLPHFRCNFPERGSNPRRDRQVTPRLAAQPITAESHNDNSPWMSAKHHCRATHCCDVILNQSLSVRTGDWRAESLQSAWGKRFELFNRFQGSQPGVTHAHTNISNTQDILHLCMVNTFPTCHYLCGCVNIWSIICRPFCVQVNQSHWSALYLSPSRTLVFICFCPLSDIAVLAYDLSGKCSLSLSHAVHVFTTDLKFNSYTTWHITEPF